MLVVAKLLCFFLITFQGVGSQNSIKPRRSKSNLTNGVPSCPEVMHGSLSKCKNKCLNDGDCENKGDDLKCCPTASRSSCKAECRKAVRTPHGGRICYDFENERQYTLGDVFIKNGICCQCHLGGIMNCSKAESCSQGCDYNSKYYNQGDYVYGSKCRNCSCHNGAIYCRIKPNCTQGKCKYKGKVYKPNHVIKLDRGCKECVCENRGWKCSTITCDAERSTSSAISLPRLKTSLLLLQVLVTHFWLLVS